MRGGVSILTSGERVNVQERFKRAKAISFRGGAGFWACLGLSFLQAAACWPPPTRNSG